jgi:acyl-CoA synthetase (NDP forming)
MAGRTARESLGALFNPRSIAIIGASTNPAKLSGRPLPNLQRSRFSGEIYVVNPRVDQIDGVRSYPSVDAIGSPIDVALIVLPAEQAVEAALAAAKAGAKAAIVGVSGFAESGDQRGRELQSRLSQIAAETGMRIVGPNTNGIYNAVNGLSLGYNSAHGEDIAAGPVSIVSHSGAMLSIFAERLKAARVGLSKFVAVGNESDLDMLDYLDYLVDDPDTQIIALLMESIADGSRFKDLARRAATNHKRIAVLKLGQSAEGAQATAAHSSRLAGSARSYEALFAQLGIASVSTPEALIAAVALASRTGVQPGSGTGLGIITYSGAASSIAADSASNAGLPLVTFGPDTMAALATVPRSAPITNPLDIGGVGGVEHSEQVFSGISGDPDVRLVLVYAHVLQTASQRRAVFEALRTSCATSSKPHVVLAPGGLTDDEIAWLDTIDVSYFTDTAVCFAALASYWRWVDNQDCGHDQAWAGEHAAVLTGLLEAAGGTTLSEHESLSLLDAASLPTVERRHCDHLEEIHSAAEALGYPVVLKAVVEGVAHKSDLGLVEVAISSSEELDAAAGRLKENPAAANAAGYLVERMMASDLEVIAGVTTEPGLGQFLVFGLGGILAEAIDSISLVPLPASRQQIGTVLAQSRLGILLASERWRYRETEDQLLDALTNLACLAEAAGPRIAAIDVNPLSISSAGVTAVDALVILAGQFSAS